MGKLEELTISQRRVLRRMGVSLYYKRQTQQQVVSEQIPVSDSVEFRTAQVTGVSSVDVPSMDVPSMDVPSMDVPSMDEAATHAPIQFSWMRGDAGMVLVNRLPEELQGVVRDVVGFLDWRLAARASRITTGDFRWPQLATSGGNPSRPLNAFYTKHFHAESHWMLIDRSVADQVLEHFAQPDHLRIFLLDEFETLLSDAVKKKALWQTLAK